MIKKKKDEPNKKPLLDKKTADLLGLIFEKMGISKRTPVTERTSRGFIRPGMWRVAINRSSSPPVRDPRPL
jgi:hypothetical protein